MALRPPKTLPGLQPCPQTGLEAKARTRPCVLAGGRVSAQSQLRMRQAGLLWGLPPGVTDSRWSTVTGCFRRADDSASGVWLVSGPDGVSPLPGWGKGEGGH